MQEGGFGLTLAIAVEKGRGVVERARAGTGSWTKLKFASWVGPQEGRRGRAHHSERVDDLEEEVGLRNEGCRSK